MSRHRHSADADDTGYAPVSSANDLPLFTETRDAAFHKITGDRQHLSESQQLVLNAIKNLGHASFQEISQRLDWAVNRVIPRVAELRTSGHVVAGEKRPCNVTGQTVQTWTAAKHGAVAE